MLRMGRVEALKIEEYVNSMGNEPTLRDLFVVISQIQADIRNGNEQTAIYRSELEAAKTRIVTLENAQTSTNEKLNSFKQDLEQMRSYYRKNNFIIHKLPETSNETTSTLVKEVHRVLTEYMHINIDLTEIDATYRLGGKKSDAARPVLTRVTCLWRKYEVLEANKLLKEHHLSVTDDYSVEARNIRRNLIPYLSEARRTNHKAFLRKDKMLVDGKLYSLEEVRSMNFNPQPQDTGTKPMIHPERDKRRADNGQSTPQTKKKPLSKATTMNLAQFKFQKRSPSPHDAVIHMSA
ncbi:hypothetical protein O3M35_008300 [Rhynocoris fuscipes]|uniref:Uncharacterized protein n=1 Tax=Rhynocoris fuscipes TaxID=488301 RepID=A0AAW1D844_9HEMI